jgi:hypothetical protein
MAKLQFSIAGLFSTVTGIAVVLWLMIRVDPNVGTPILLALTLTCLAFACVALLHGHGNVRPFSVGLAVPLIYSLAEASFSGIILNVPIEGIVPVLSASVTITNRASIALGSAILIGVALGCLCVVFRWIIDRPKRDDEKSRC